MTDSVLLHDDTVHRGLAAYTVGDLLRVTAQQQPDRTGLVAHVAGEELRLTFVELLGQAENVARALLEVCKPGEHLGLVTANRGEGVIVQFAAALAGIVLVPVNPMLRARELGYVVEHAGLSAIITSARIRDDELAARVQEAAGDSIPVLVFEDDWDGLLTAREGNLPVVSQDSVAQIQFTSGSTGSPKGVTVTHYGMVVTGHGFADRIGLTGGGAWVNPMPQFHTAGNVLGTIGALWAQAPHVVLPFDADDTVRAVDDENAAFVSAAPTLLRQMIYCDAVQSARLDSLEVVFTGGATMDEEFVRLVESTFGARLSCVFGMTETCGAALQTSPTDELDDRTFTVGTPLPGTDVSVVDSEGTPTPRGVPGELCVRGRRISTGYHAMPDATAAAFDDDGWLRTGDLASMDDRGYVAIKGRLKEMIKSGGENVSPAEVESVLARYPGIDEVAVVGVKDDVWGELVVAVIARTSGSIDTAELVEYCRVELAPHKRPRSWASISRLPLTATGKMSRLDLRQQLETGILPLTPTVDFAQSGQLVGR